MTDYSSDMANKQNYPQAQPVVSNQQSYPPPVAPDFTQTYITATYTDYSQPPVSQAYGTGYPAAYPIQTQGEGYPQQAYTYPAGSVHQTHHQATTTAPVPVMMTYAMLDEGPTMVSCPHCQRTGMTNVSYTPSFAAIASAFFAQFVVGFHCVVYFALVAELACMINNIIVRTAMHLSEHAELGNKVTEREVSYFK
eukprot:CAMPEP_0196585420 /NCGR_PEP_ID=MMETSP1081-20130531/50582_1 /TAXON_ID=36882 /ORGANISM="Pyramimonas amylifera, Strain CCMP720" /LENGTH=194 /DNA_ID=CAMNT_0041906953 /DNA_START=97 /DNA_END=682 /DNA_ORIENTATION=+